MWNLRNQNRRLTGSAVLWQVCSHVLRGSHADGTPQTEWAHLRLARLVQFIFVFSRPRRRFSYQKECELNCLSRSTENPTVGTVLQRTRLLSPTGDTEFLRSSCLAPASASKKGKAERDNTKWFAGSGGVAMATPTVHLVISPSWVQCRFAECFSCGEDLSKIINKCWRFRICGPSVKTRRAASHCPFWSAWLLMLPRFHFVACATHSTSRTAPRTRVLDEDHHTDIT